MMKVKFRDRQGFMEMMARRGLTTIKEFAEFCDLGYATAQTIAQGKRNPAARVALKISRSLSIPFDDLFSFVHEGGYVNERERETKAQAAIK